MQGFPYVITIDSINWLSRADLDFSQVIAANLPDDVTDITMPPHTHGYYVVGLNAIGVPGTDPEDESLLAGVPFTGTIFIDGTDTNELSEFDVLFRVALAPQYSSDDQDMDKAENEEPTSVLEENINVIRVPIDEAVTYRSAIIDQGMVPLRLIAEALGANVNWDESTRTITITKNDMNLSLQVDASLSDGMSMPSIVDGRTFVPITYVAKMLEVEISWDEVNQAVYILE